jgi:uncharacterized protein YceK
MKRKNKKLILSLTIMMLSGCSVSMTTTNTTDAHGKVKVTKEFKATKNTQTIKVLGTVAAIILAARLDNGTGIMSAIMGYDISSKQHKLAREKLEWQKKTTSEKI